MSANPNAIIRQEVKVYQDFAPQIDQDAIKAVVAEKITPRKYDLNLNRLPRPNVRSARILDVQKLRDKIRIRAEIVDEQVDQVVYQMADMLENMEPEEIYQAAEREVSI